MEECFIINWEIIYILYRNIFIYSALYMEVVLFNIYNVKIHRYYNALILF